MQVMPDTGAWVAQQLSLARLSPRHVVRSRAKLGHRHMVFAAFDQLFNGNLVTALAAYNAGQTRVQQWLNEQRWDGHEETIDDIPFSETRTYVRRVLGTLDTYVWLYGGAEQQVSKRME